MVDSNPDAENPDAVTPGAVDPDAVVPDAVVSPAADIEVPELDIPPADLPELEIPEPKIPEPVIPPSLMEAPVIPPAPADTPVTRADWRSTWTSQSDAPASVRPRVRAKLAAAAQPAGPVVVPEPSLAPEDVVPPESGASSGSYRGLTVVIFGILLALLIGAIVVIAVLISGGISPFPGAESVVGIVHGVSAPV